MKNIHKALLYALTVLGPIVGPGGAASSYADPMSNGLVRSYPRANDVVDGSMVDIVLGFGIPVDHERSKLILRSDRGDRQLKPRLESAPNYLFGVAGRLLPGAYELEWSAWLSDGQTRSGKIPFTVDFRRDVERQSGAALD